MAKNSQVTAVTPAQAQWIVERLIAERRISAADVRRLVSGLEGEIKDIEQRLARLRETAGQGSAASAAPRKEGPTRTTPKNAKTRKKKGHVRGIAGTLAVLLRSIPAAEHAAIEAIRADKGIKAAIKAAQQVLAKRSG